MEAPCGSRYCNWDSWGRDSGSMWWYSSWLLPGQLTWQFLGPLLILQMAQGSRLRFCRYSGVRQVSMPAAVGWSKPEIWIYPHLGSICISSNLLHTKTRGSLWHLTNLDTMGQEWGRAYKTTVSNLTHFLHGNMTQQNCWEIRARS